MATRTRDHFAPFPCARDANRRSWHYVAARLAIVGLPCAHCGTRSADHELGHVRARVAFDGDGVKRASLDPSSRYGVLPSCRTCNASLGEGRMTDENAPYARQAAAEFRANVAWIVAAHGADTARAIASALADARAEWRAAHG